MKKILTSLALLGAFAFGANAQRTTGVEGVWISPDNSAAYTIPCTDSFEIHFAYINRGPETVLATDTFFYFGPSTPEGRVNYTLHNNQPIAPNDTIANVRYKLTRSSIQRLVDESATEWVFPPFANGNYIMFTQAGGFTNSATPPANVLEIDESSSAPIPADALGIIINCAVSIKDANFSKSTLSIYPNPASSVISFETGVINGEATVRITDLTGRTVMVKDLGKQVEGTKTFTVDVATLTQGMYFVEFVNGTNKAISKVTIK